MNKKKKTIGIRIPDHKIALALLEYLGEPLMTSTLILADSELPLSDADDIRDKLEKHVDLIIDGGHCGQQPTSVIDLTGNSPLVIRAGQGDISPFE